MWVLMRLVLVGRFDRIRHLYYSLEPAYSAFPNLAQVWLASSFRFYEI